MKDFYNGLFALGMVAGAGACILIFILLEWFGFTISANNGFLAALLGAFVGGSFTIAAQMMAADATAKQAKKERDEQSLKIEKAIAQSIFLKIHDYQNEVIPMGQHYSTRTKSNSLIINEKPVLALESPYSLPAVKFTMEEKSMCLDWKNHNLFNGLNDMEGLSTNLEILHNGYSSKIRAYVATFSPTARGYIAEATSEISSENDVNFQELARILWQINNEFPNASDLLPKLSKMIEKELTVRFGVKLKYQ